ncbi:hypothetical protein J4457_06255 [Candidatus Woesearchaeota archaeon]|nr:hypothetical protein [Candidatus Woesearchaeota archaeon]
MVEALVRRLQRTGRDQYILTIPKHLVQILRWQEHQLLSFGFEKGRLSVETTEQEQQLAQHLARKLQCTPKQQFTLTIPKHLVQILHWQNKDEIQFDFEKNKITLTQLNGLKGGGTHE